MSEKRRFEFDWAGRPLVVEIGEMGKQANGAAMITYGDSSVFSTVVTVNKASSLDFFPLMVIYQEKLYAAGKIPGGFLKREGRPSEHETLTSRVIDRPIRPLFPEGFRNEVQIVNTVMSSDPNCSTEMAAMFGSSIVLGISDVPFNGPIAGVEVGRIDGEYILMPTPEQKEKSDIALTVAGTKYAVNMIEAGAREVSEDAMLGAILFGHEAIKQLIAFEEEIIKEVGKPKMEVSLFEVDQEIRKQVYDYAYDRLVKAIVIEDKLERYAAIDAINEETLAKFDEKVFIKDLDGVKVLFITPRETLSNVKAVKKHLEKMQSLSGCFVSLLLNDISETRKKSFLENHIPFVVTNNQIYLPFMAIYLQEKNKTIIEAVSQLTPAAQLVFINFFKQNSEALAVANFAKKLQFSEMSTTRALRQLVATGLFEIKKGPITNSNLLVTKVKDKEELFNKMEPYLINPVKNSFYIDKEEIKTNKDFVPSGVTYLSMFSMLGKEELDTWAFYGKATDFKTATSELTDVSRQARIEIWKYNPKLVCLEETNDSISVYLSLKNSTDARISKENKKLIAKVIGDSNANTWS